MIHLLYVHHYHSFMFAVRARPVRGRQQRVQHQATIVPRAHVHVQTLCHVPPNGWHAQQQVFLQGGRLPRPWHSHQRTLQRRQGRHYSAPRIWPVDETFSRKSRACHMTRLASLRAHVYISIYVFLHPILSYMIQIWSYTLHNYMTLLHVWSACQLKQKCAASHQLVPDFQWRRPWCLQMSQSLNSITHSTQHFFLSVQLSVKPSWECLQVHQPVVSTLVVLWWISTPSGKLHHLDLARAACGQALYTHPQVFASSHSFLAHSVAGRTLCPFLLWGHPVQLVAFLHLNTSPHRSSLQAFISAESHSCPPTISLITPATNNFSALSPNLQVSGKEEWADAC